MENSLFSWESSVRASNHCSWRLWWNMKSCSASATTQLKWTLLWIMILHSVFWSSGFSYTMFHLTSKNKHVKSPLPSAQLISQRRCWTGRQMVESAISVFSDSPTSALNPSLKFIWSVENKYLASWTTSNRSLRTHYLPRRCSDMTNMYCWLIQGWLSQLYDAFAFFSIGLSTK